MQEVNDPHHVVPQSDVSEGASDDVFIFPASFAQQRLWFLDKLQPGQSAYNVPFALRFRGDLEIDVLERVLRELIARHEVLRTTFSEDKTGKPIQLVAAKQDFALSVTDLRRIPNEVREDEARRLVIEHVRLPFDLKRGPLFRATLLCLSDNEHVLSFALHHSIVDGWSLSILVKEFSALYDAFVQSRPSPLPALPLQYGDYATWQQDWLQGERLETLLRYWKKQLEGAPSVIELPTDFARPPVHTYIGAQESIVLPRKLVDALMQLSQNSGATLFMTLLGAFDVLLARYSGQEDIVVGSPISGRTRSELEGLIGFFVNSLGIRINVSGNPSFRELLGRVRETTLQAYAHQDLPFEKLVEELRPERDLSRNPVFQVMLLLQNAHASGVKLANLEGDAFPLPAESSKFDMTLVATETREGLRTTIVYNTDLFEASTIERMLGHYQVLLEAAAADPDLKLSQLPLLTPVERRQILVDWNATDAELPRQQVHELFEAQVHRTPDSVAVVHGERELTYGELNARANQLAHHLRALGVQAGDKVATVLERSIDLVAAELAILKCGAAYVPIDPAFPSERKSFVITDCGAKIVLSTEGMEVPRTRAATRVNTEDTPLSAEATSNLNIGLDSEATAYVMYTSGSTGQPKGVLVPHRAIKRLVLNNGYAKFEASDRVAFASNPAFDATTLEVWAPLLNGGRIVVLDQWVVLEPAGFGHALKRYGITVLWLTVGLFNEYADALSEQLASLRYLITGGDALDPRVIARVLHRNPPQHLLNGYGPTETTTFAATHEIRAVPENARSIPIGRPIANTRIYILDRNRQPVPVGATGELHIAGAGVAQGYLNRPDLTAERFVEDPFADEPGARMYKTGDLARWLRDGTIEFLGRNDFQVKLRGYRIELGEIEAVLKKHSSVQDCVVTVREDVPGDMRLIGYVLPRPKHTNNASDLRLWVKERLPDYMVPAAFVELEKFPLSSNGKIDRKALPRPNVVTAASGTVVPPRDELEAKLLKIWQEILNAGTIGVTDNFFDLGGHSLMAIRLMNEIKRLTNVDIPLAALFQGATIEHLASIIRGGTAVSQTVVHRIQTGGDRPPFFAAVLAGINALGYVPLGKHLGSEQPFYALQAPGPGPRARKRPYSRKEYEEISGEYVRAMRTVQPHGPYYLGGMCEGARIAFEMTRVLESQGETVNLLAVFDTWVLENTQNRKLWKIYYYASRLRQLWRMPWNSKVEITKQALRNRMKRWAGPKSAPALSEWVETYWPGENFVPPRVQSRITVLKVPKQPFYYHKDPLLGWGTRTTSGVDTEIIPNGRHRLLLREPYVREVAAALSGVLERARNSAQAGDGLTIESDASEAAPALH